MTNNLKQSSEQFLNLMDRVRRVGPQIAPPKEADISPSQLAFLTFLNLNPGCGIQTIASGLKLSKPTVSIGVSHLEESGFLVRQTDPHDGRAVQLFLTPEGQKLHQLTLEFRCKKFECLLKDLTPQERMTLINLLEKAIQAAENKALGEVK